MWGGGAGGANDSAALEALTVDELNELYVRFRNEIKTDKAVEAEGRDWWKKLEAGDAEARRLWQRFRDVSWAEFESAYEMLGIRFDEVRGESAYEADMPRVIEELGKKNLTSISDGALVVELAGEKTPILLRTTDGTSLYATRDVATAEYRWNTYHFTRSLYVVDRGQSLHFKQLFKLLALAGHEWASKCEHIPFGLVRIGGKKTGTRTGNVLLLKEVFAEAVEDIADRMASSDTRRADGGGSGHTVSADDLQATARMVGIGAVVFGTLVTQRDKDVDFDWEKVLSMDGDSGPYLQYSHARCASIRRKGGGENVSGASLAALQTDAEWSVARKLLDFGDIVVRASQSCEPHLVCHYLLDLAGEFSRWYTAGNGDASLRVLCEDADTRAARLALVAAVQDALAQGLSLLGLGAPQAM